MRFTSLAAAVSVTALSAAPVALVPASAASDGKITICHRTNSLSNPYRVITVSVSAADGQGGKGDHYANHLGSVWTPDSDKKEWGDIIPPIPGVHGGRNWTLEGQTIWNNGCKPLLLAPVPAGLDTDKDGLLDIDDEDDDNDNVPDTVDPDDDNDGVDDLDEPEIPEAPLVTPDPREYDPDTDGDEIPNSVDPDDDNDGVDDITDPDDEGDGIPDASDPDDDNDGVDDTNDPDDRHFDPDSDGDDVPNSADPDDDNDGVDDITDPDDEGDGIPDASDPDDDNDGVIDPDAPDQDDDGDPDLTDPDDDNDGTPDPKDRDRDNDNTPNRLDRDDDGDRIVDTKDPSNPATEVLVTPEDKPDTAGQWSKVLLLDAGRPEGTGPAVMSVRISCEGIGKPSAQTCDARIVNRIVQMRTECVSSAKLHVIARANNARPVTVTKPLRVSKRTATAAGEVSPQAACGS